MNYLKLTLGLSLALSSSAFANSTGPDNSDFITDNPIIIDVIAKNTFADYNPTQVTIYSKDKGFCAKKMIKDRRATITRNDLYNDGCRDLDTKKSIKLLVDFEETFGAGHQEQVTTSVGASCVVEIRESISPIMAFSHYFPKITCQ